MNGVLRRVSPIALSLLVAAPCVAQSTGGFRLAVSELAFVHDGQIFRVRFDGSEPLQLTSDGVNSEPAWSPDGTRIAFVRDQSTPAHYASDIYVMNADGSNVVRRTNGGANFSPAWSRDGTRIAFSSVRDGQFGIYVMRVDEDWWNPTHLGFDRGWNAYPAWSPDGSKIAFVSDWRAYDFLYDLYVMNADGSDMRLLLGGPFFSPGLTYYFQPAWSPDGGTIALTVCPYAWSNCFPDSAVALINADGSGLRSMSSAGGLARPSWSPDGSRIAFGSSECPDCPSSIKYVTRDGSQSGVLVWNAHSPTWRPVTGGQLASPDGTTVPTATQIVDNDGAVWTIASNLLILRNDATVLGWQGSKILWKSSAVYVLGMDGNWWQWTASNWLNTGPAMPGGSGATSPDGALVPTTASQIVDNTGAVWTIGSNLLILRNGATVLGWQGSKILWKSSAIYVLGMDSNWWQWAGSLWVNVGPLEP